MIRYLYRLQLEAMEQLDSNVSKTAFTKAFMLFVAEEVFLRYKLKVIFSDIKTLRVRELSYFEIASSVIKRVKLKRIR